MSKKLYPYINKFTGEIQILPKSQGAKLSEDWGRAKTVVNDDGKKVFRFTMQAPVVGPDGVTHMGTATIDISEVTQAEAPADGDGNPE